MSKEEKMKESERYRKWTDWRMKLWKDWDGNTTEESTIPFNDWCRKKRGFYSHEEYGVVVMEHEEEMKRLRWTGRREAWKKWRDELEKSCETDDESITEKKEGVENLQCLPIDNDHSGVYDTNATQKDEPNINDCDDSCVDLVIAVSVAFIAILFALFAVLVFGKPD